MGGRGGRLVRLALLGLLLVASVFFFSACGGARNEVRFGTVDWPEAIAKTNVAATVVEALGYETQIQELSVPTVFEGLESGLGDRRCLCSQSAQERERAGRAFGPRQGDD